MTRVITAKRADECRTGECTAETRTIAAGEQINYGGYQAVSHAACAPVEAARNRPAVRSYATRSGYYGRTSWGRGRCEDAPCCGCCD